MADPLAYATPAGYADDAAGLRRLGPLVIAARGPADVDLPPRCVRCNAAVSSDHCWGRTVRYVRTGYYWLLLLNYVGIVLLGAAVLIAGRSARVTAGLCDHHWAQRRRRLGACVAASVVGAFLAAAGVVGAGVRPGSWWPIVWGVVGAVLLIAGVTGATLWTPILRAVWIGPGTACLSGAGPAFLDAFPDVDLTSTLTAGTPSVGPARRGAHPL